MAGRADGRRFVSTRVEVEGREEIRTVELPAFEVEPWTEGAALGIVGCCAPRADGMDKVTGIGMRVVAMTACASPMIVHVDADLRVNDQQRRVAPELFDHDHPPPTG